MARMGQNMSLDEIIDRLANCQPGSVAHGQMMAEITLMQLRMQIEALEAQKAAAIAQKDAADAAKSNANWMFWSVMAASASAVITAGSILFNVISVR